MHAVAPSLRALRRLFAIQDEQAEQSFRARSARESMLSRPRIHALLIKVRLVGATFLRWKMGESFMMRPSATLYSASCLPARISTLNQAAARCLWLGGR